MTTVRGTTAPPETDAARDGALLIRFGGAAAIAGTILSVAAGIGFGNVAELDTTSAQLARLADRPMVLWAGVQIAFALGALLWVWAFVALTRLLAGGAQAIAQLGLVSIAVGAAVHVTDSGLASMAATIADEWSAASGPDRADAFERGRLLLTVLDGTWGAVIAFFHGVPFVVMGLAVGSSRRWSPWLGGIGVVGGTGSLVCGLALIAGADIYLPYVVFAVLLSIWMLVLGVSLLRTRA